MLARVFSASLANRASSNCVRSFATMGVEVQKISPGNGQYPQKGQTVSVHYVELYRTERNLTAAENEASL